MFDALFSIDPSQNRPHKRHRLRASSAWPMMRSPFGGVRLQKKHTSSPITFFRTAGFLLTLGLSTLIVTGSLTNGWSGEPAQRPRLHHRIPLPESYPAASKGWVKKEPASRMIAVRHKGRILAYVGVPDSVEPHEYGLLHAAHPLPHIPPKETRMLPIKDDHGRILAFTSAPDIEPDSAPVRQTVITMSGPASMSAQDMAELKKEVHASMKRAVTLYKAPSSSEAPKVLIAAKRTRPPAAKCRIARPHQPNLNQIFLTEQEKRAHQNVVTMAHQIQTLKKLNKPGKALALFDSLSSYARSNNVFGTSQARASCTLAGGLYLQQAQHILTHNPNRHERINAQYLLSKAGYYLLVGNPDSASGNRDLSYLNKEFPEMMKKARLAIQKDNMLGYFTNRSLNRSTGPKITQQRPQKAFPMPLI
ncbi:MAG: hypothetical protein AB7E52_05535 [Bdellovibrionales bacterium]